MLTGGSLPARACVYTVCFGTQDRLLEQPVRADSAMDFIAFVDDPAVVSKTWQVRPLVPLLPADLARSSRYPKICAHRVLPDYDVSLYIDASVLLKLPPERLFDDLLSQRPEPMACPRTDITPSVFEQTQAVIAYGFDRADICREQLAAYVLDGFAGTVPTLWTAIMLRHHHRPEVVELMELWFAHVLRYSRRDQIALPYLVEKMNFQLASYEMSNRETQWHRWPVQGRDDRDPYRATALAQTGAMTRRLAEAERELASLRLYVAELGGRRPALPASPQTPRPHSLRDRLRRRLAAIGAVASMAARR